MLLPLNLLAYLGELYSAFTPIKNGRVVLASLQGQVFQYLLDSPTTPTYSRIDMLQPPTPYTASSIVSLK